MKITNKDVVFMSYILIYTILAFLAVFKFNVDGLVCSTFLIVGMLVMLGLKRTKVNNWFEKPFRGNEDEQ
jgi:hypothetical protein